MNMKEVYQEYLECWHSVILDSWKEADQFIEYLKLIGYKPKHNIKMSNCQSMGKHAVHVCEPMYVK